MQLVAQGEGGSQELLQLNVELGRDQAEYTVFFWLAL